MYLQPKIILIFNNYSIKVYNYTSATLLCKVDKKTLASSALK